MSASRRFATREVRGKIAEEATSFYRAAGQAAAENAQLGTPEGRVRAHGVGASLAKPLRALSERALKNQAAIEGSPVFESLGD